MNTKTSKIACLTVASCITSYANAAVMTFTPDTLAEFQTSGDIIYQPGSTTASSTLSDPTSESPEQLRVITSISGPDNVTFTHDLIGATFNPSAQGAINSIDFTMSVNDPNLGDSDTPILLGIEQGGNTYFYTENNTSAFLFRNSGSTSFLLFDKNNLTASNFGLFLGTSETAVNSTMPDFSISGGNIQFLYGSIGATSTNTFERNTDFHSSELSVNYTAVPEPSSSVLLALGSAALILRRRK